MFLIVFLIVSLIVFLITHSVTATIFGTVHGCKKGMKPVKSEVIDDDQGFAYQNLDMKFPGKPGLFRNSGFPLINACAGEIEFNKGGSRIIITCMRWVN